MKHTVKLISICLLIFCGSLVIAQQITVSPGQTFTVYASVYKPENIPFPSDGARLYAGLCNPNNYLETYNVGGWGVNTIYLQWDNEERRENFSLEVTVEEDAPSGTGASLRVLLSLDTNDPIYANSNVVLALEAVEVRGERISKYMPGTLVGPPDSPTGNYYFIAVTDVFIAAAELPLPLWALVVIVILVVLIIVVVAVGWKKHGVETPSLPTGPE